MDITFEKYNDKSFVVRGKNITDLQFRQGIISKLSGRCMYNVKLKGGSGLLVPINEHNSKTLDSFFNKEIFTEKNEKMEHDNSKELENSHSDNKTENDYNDENVYINNLLQKLINEKSDNEDSDTEIINKKKVSNEKDSMYEPKLKSVIIFPNEEEHDSNRKSQTFEITRDNIKKEKNRKMTHKDKKVSIREPKLSSRMSSSQGNDRKRETVHRRENDERRDVDVRDTRRDKRDEDKSRNVRESESRDIRRDVSRRETDERRSKKDIKDRENSRRESEERRSRRRRHRDSSSSRSSSSSSSSSSDDSSDSSEYSDSSEDERIEHTIRKKGQRPNRRQIELDNSDVDSDHEDVVTLSRRVRYLYRKIKNIEQYLRK